MAGGWKGAGHAAWIQGFPSGLVTDSFSAFAMSRARGSNGFFVFQRFRSTRLVPVLGFVPLFWAVVGTDAGAPPKLMA